MTTQPQDIISEFFTQLLGYDPQPEVTHEEEEILVQLDLDTSQSGVIIGYRGEVLGSIQLILSLMVQQHTNQWCPVRLNVNDYKQQRLKALENLAINTAARVVQTGDVVRLNNLSSYERRIIHSLLSENSQVTTYSEGENPHRVLVIAPQN